MTGLSRAVTRPIKVLMTADAVGGVFTYALDAAAGLAPFGIETTLAVLGPAPSDDQRTAARAAGVVLVEAAAPLDWMAASADEVAAAGAAVTGLADEMGPDVVHLNAPALGAQARFAAPVVAAAHSCVATWWRSVRSGPLPADFVWRAALVRASYLTAEAVIAPTAAFATATAEAYSLRTQPIVIRNGRQLPAIHTRPAELFVFTAGRLWDEGKDLATLDRAAARLSFLVRAAGPCEGPNGTRVSLSHVAALGRLPAASIVHELEARPIFVSTSRYEPFGLAVLEAAQAGCALVLADIPTFRELWDGVASFFPPGDDRALTGLLESLAADRVGCARLGGAAQKRATAYSIEAMCGALARLYRQLAGAARDAA